MDKAQVQSLTQAVPVWWDWEVVRAGKAGTRGMGKKGRAEGKGKKDDDEPVGIRKGVAISTSPLLA